MLCASVGLAEDASKSDMDLVIARYRSLLCAGRPASAGAVLKYAESISGDGSWKDIVYADSSMAGWKTVDHLNRIRDMSFVLAVDKKLQKEKARVFQAVNLALDHWCAKRYRCNNWWYNEICVPGVMRDIVVLLGDDLKGDRRQAALEVLGQFKVGNTAANLMWAAELALHHGCLTVNRKQVEESARRMWAEIVIGSREGIQSDWSFYQHGARLQTFHYGSAYLDIAAKIAWQLRQTPLAIPNDKRDIISNYILGGPQWMCRGVYTVPGTIDRAVSRRGSMSAGSLRSVLALWQEVDPGRIKDFRAVIERQSGAGAPLVGYRHFPKADFTVYHRPQASFFLKTVSERTGLTESINSENLKGVPYLNCGDHYVLQDGLEYRDLQPVWQWQYLPGLTMLPGDTKPKRTRFVGGVGDGQSGMTAMDYVREGADGSSLSVRKTWFFHGDVVVCLMGGLEVVKDQVAAVSAIEQCRLRGPVKARIGNAKKVLKPGSSDLAKTSWILHNNIGYMPINMEGVKVFTGPRTGDWHSLANQYDDKTVTEDVFQVLAGHGKREGAQGWAIILGATEQGLDALARNPPWRVIRNDRDCQCMLFVSGTRLVMSSFFAPGSIGEPPELSVDKPCLVMWDKNRMWLCDPTMAGETVSVKWKQKERSVKLPPAGAVTQIDL